MKSINFNKYIISIILLWTVAIAAVAYYALEKEKDHIYKTEVKMAKIAYQKDLMYRKWTSRHGGVYIHLSDYTPPNPYLSSFEKRDIITKDNDTLTLINPGYMTRQVMELFQAEYKIKGKIVSLEPINPNNKPDSTEKEALLNFEKGDTAFFRTENINGIEYTRYIKPLFVEESCLKCHYKQECKKGEIIGALSISVPNEELSDLNKFVLNYILIWVLGFVVILVIMLLLKKKMKEVSEGQKIISGLNSELSVINKTLYEKAEQLKQLNKTREKFMSIIAHDLKSPFTALIGFSSLLENSFDEYDDESKKDFIHEISQTSKHTYLMLNNLLGWAMSQKGSIPFKPKQMNLSKVIEDCLKITKNAAEIKSITVKSECVDKVELSADSNMLNTIFRNLMANAIKFTNEGGEIKIEVSKNEECVVVKISDNGIGMSDEQIKNLWTEEKEIEHGTKGEKGTGLGLILCKEFVERHNGEINVTSEIGKGSQFEVKLPLNS